MKIIQITENQYKEYLYNDICENNINEIDYVANKSNITVSSLQDFKKICTNLGINDSNVEQYIGQYCFIEIGSSISRLQAEVPHIHSVYDENGSPYDAKTLYEKGQWYFNTEHKNVMKLIFDDNQKFNNKIPKNKNFDGNTPVTAVKLSSKENIYNKNFVFYYTNGEDFTNDKAFKLKKFVDVNLSVNPNVKFIIHCKQGKSRSAAVGIYISSKIKQFSDEMLSEYDIDDNNSQFNIGVNRRGQPKYPHKNVMNKLGAIEGWNKETEPSRNQWYYDILINHPRTGYNDRK